MSSKDHRPAPARIIPVFVIVALVFGMSATAMLVMGRVIENAERDVAGEQAVIDELRQTLSDMKDAETGQRGYLLTGAEAVWMECRGSGRAPVRRSV